MRKMIVSNGRRPRLSKNRTIIPEEEQLNKRHYDDCDYIDHNCDCIYDDCDDMDTDQRADVNAIAEANATSDSDATSDVDVQADVDADVDSTADTDTTANADTDSTSESSANNNNQSTATNNIGPINITTPITIYVTCGCCGKKHRFAQYDVVITDVQPEDANIYVEPKDDSNQE